MPRRAGEDDLVVEERLEGDAAVPASGPDDPELEVAAGDELDDGLRVEHRERHVELRVLRLELAEELGEHDPAGARGGADLERAAERALALAADLGDELLLEREQPPRAAVEPKPRFGRLDAPPRAIEKLRPKRS